MKRKDLTAEKVVKGSSYLCSQHFMEQDYLPNAKRCVLKENAVPSVFAFPEHMKVKHARRKYSERKVISKARICPDTF